MLDAILSLKNGRRLGALGLIVLAVGAILVTFMGDLRDIRDADEAECGRLKEAAGNLPANDGTFKILNVTPGRTGIDKLVCVIVAGVVKEEGSGARAVELKLFLNDAAATHVKVQAEPLTGPQAIKFRLTAPSNATADGAVFWRDILSDGKAAGASDLRLGERQVSIGLSRSDATSPAVMAPKPVTLVVYDPWTFWAGVGAFLLLFVSFVSFARNSTLLRDNARTVGDYYNEAENARMAEAAAVKAATADASSLKNERKALEGAEQALAAAPADAAKLQAVTDAKARVTAAEAKLAASRQGVEASKALTAKAETELQSVGSLENSDNANLPTGPFSLAKTQMAFWLLLTIAGFVFIWLSVGQYYNLITPAILVLLGISGTTGLASITLNDPKDEKTKTVSFVDDILNDGDGPRLHRIQAAAWTLILGAIFAWNVFWNFRFVDFDSNLLLLIGIAQGLYLGFKSREGKTT